MHTRSLPLSTALPAWLEPLGFQSMDLAMFTTFAIYQIAGKHNVNMQRHRALVEFLHNLYRLTRISPIVVLLALRYLDRFRTLVTTSTPQSLSSSGLFVSALVVANHMLDDNAYTNKTWAQATNVQPAIINSTQRQFLGLLQYNLHVGADEMELWCHEMRNAYHQMLEIRHRAAVAQQRRAETSMRTPPKNSQKKNNEIRRTASGTVIPAHGLASPELDKDMEDMPQAASQKRPIRNV